MDQVCSPVLQLSIAAKSRAHGRIQRIAPSIYILVSENTVG